MALKGSYAEKKLLDKLECMVLCRMRDKSRMKKALDSQDRIREQVKNSRSENCVIRKWRARDAHSFLTLQL